MQNAIVSSFPISEQPSEQDQRVMRRQAEILVVEASDPVAEMAHRTRMYVLRDLIAQDYNTAVTLLTADFRTVQDKNPAEAYACRIVIDSWLIANGMRAIKWDEKVSSTIQAGREVRKKGLLRRWVEERFLTDGQKQTALIHEALDLAGKNEALRLENHRLATANQEIEARSQRMFIEASGKGEAVIARTQSEAREILSYARSEAEKRERTAERRLEKLQQDIANLEQAKRQMLTESPGLGTALGNHTDEADDFQSKMLSVTKRLRATSGSCNRVDGLRSGIRSFISVVSRIVDIAFEFDDRVRARLLSMEIDLTGTYLNTDVADRSQHLPIIDQQNMKSFLVALGGPESTKESLLRPFTTLLDQLEGKLLLTTGEAAQMHRKLSAAINDLASKAASTA